MKRNTEGHRKLENNFKWKDIIFEKHHAVKNGVSAQVVFENGHWASIVGAEYDENLGFFRLYGDGKTSFGILSSVSEKYACNGFVKSWCSKKQVMSHLKYISKLNNNK